MNQSDVFSIVADPDRRRLLQTLLENDGQATVENLTSRIAAHREETTPGRNDLERTKVRLLHNHLPRLQDHGLIDYDQQSGDVELDTAMDLEPYVTGSFADPLSTSLEQ